MKNCKYLAVLGMYILLCNFISIEGLYNRCGASQVDAGPCCARPMGRFNPYYYVYQGYFRTYNWRLTPLNINRLMGPQAFMGPTA